MRASQLLLLLTCLTALITRTSTQDTCKRCRAFALTITCEEENDKIKMLYNGHTCAAKAGSNVKLKCTLDDSDGVQVQYEWYKSNSVSGKSFKDQTTGASKISNCTTSECNIYNVKWKDDTDISSHDSFFYQCIVKVNPNGTHSPVFFSNAFPLSVQSYTPGSPVATEKQTIDIGSSEVKLPCVVPKSNPASMAVWYYASSPTNNRTEISGNMGDMFVINGTIVASDSKYGYSYGMLVIMKFKSANYGSYTCVIRNKNAFGEVSDTEVSTHDLERSGTSKQDIEELIMVSHVSGPQFLFTEVDETSLSCFGASYIAGSTAHHYWQKTTEENGVLVYKNLTGSGFKYTNQNRTLILDYDANNVGVKYRCQIQKGAVTLLLNDFVQAPIIPKTGMIPTAMTCAKDGDNHVATANSLMNADPAVSSVQVLPGSSYYWHKEEKYLSKFDAGYTVNGTQLSHNINSTENCHYVQQFRYIKDLYAIQQIHAVNILEYVEQDAPKVELKQSGGSGDQPIKIECKATASYNSQLENKIGLNVIFDVGGCIEYTDALVSITPGQGTCDKSVTRTLTLNKKVMCKECVVKCMASTDCKSSSEASVTVEPAGTNCDGDTGTTTGKDKGLPGWGVALIILAIILGLITVSAVFFYTYMQKAQSASDTEPKPGKSAVTKSEDVDTSEIVKVIRMAEDNEGSPADIL